MLPSPVTVTLHVGTEPQHQMFLQVCNACRRSGVVLGPPCGSIAAGAVHKAEAFPEVLPASLKQQLLHLDVASIHGILRHFHILRQTPSKQTRPGVGQASRHLSLRSFLATAASTAPMSGCLSWDLQHRLLLMSQPEYMQRVMPRSL